MTAFKDLGDWAGTRDRLHRVLKVIAAIPRKHAKRHERWWHIGFGVREGGLWLDPFALPDGRDLALGVRIADHVVVMQVGADPERRWDAGLRPGDLAEALFEAAGGVGLEDLDPGDFADPAQGDYDPEQAERYYGALAMIDRIFKRHRSSLDGPVSPVLLWPHNFDLAFEWYGGRMIEREEDGQTTESPAQLNLGWYPGDASDPAPYFYSNPWPFDPVLKQHLLPNGARWMDGSWKGSILPYRELVGDPDAEQRLLDYARAVYRLAVPTLV